MKLILENETPFDVNSLISESQEISHIFNFHLENSICEYGRSPVGNSAKFVMRMAWNQILTIFRKIVTFFTSMFKRIYMFFKRAFDWIFKKKNPANVKYTNFRSVNLDERLLKKSESFLKNVSEMNTSDIEYLENMLIESSIVSVDDFYFLVGHDRKGDELINSLQSHKDAIPKYEKIMNLLEEKMQNTTDEVIKDQYKAMAIKINEVMVDVKDQLKVTNEIVQENLQLQKTLLKEYAVYRTLGMLSLTGGTTSLGEWLYREVAGSEERAGSLVPIIKNEADFTESKLFASSASSIISSYSPAQVRVFFSRDVGSRYSSGVFDGPRSQGAGRVKRGKLSPNILADNSRGYTFKTLTDSDLERILSGRDNTESYTHNECFIKQDAKALAVYTIASKNMNASKAIKMLQGYRHSKPKDVEYLANVVEQLS